MSLLVSLSAPHGLEFSLASVRTRHCSLPTLVTPLVDQDGTMHSSGLFVSGLHLWSKVVWEFILFFWPHCVEGRILVLQAGIEPIPTVVEVQSPNLWTAREFLPTNFRINLSNSM